MLDGKEGVNMWEKQARKNTVAPKRKTRHRPGIYERYIKRPLDFICALFAFIFLSPVMLVIAVLVRIKLGSPVIFTQERPGLHERIFRLYKFRSMSDARDKDGKLLPDGERLGRFGKALRATSLDELPELVNILKGDMSVVGPRPLLVEYLPRYSKRQHRRHDVRPGLTGYAQVHGRNGVPWGGRFAMDVWYVGHVTFLGDLGILLLTVRAVLERRGICSETSATMEEFQGAEDFDGRWEWEGRKEETGHYRCRRPWESDCRYRGTKRIWGDRIPG